MTKPLWIIVDDGKTFEGHQGQWAACFFSNATRAAIEAFLNDGDYKYTIREMTSKELKKHPEALEFAQELIDEYGEL